MSRSVKSTGGFAASEVATARRHMFPYRTAIVTAIVTVIVIAGFSLSLSAGSTIGTTATCSKSTGPLTKSSGSTLSKASSSTTLPPSRDNDVGDGRIPDQTPDADVDANQRPHICNGLK